MSVVVAKRGLLNALNTAKPFVFDCFLPDIYHFSVFFFFKRAAQQTDPLWHQKGHRSLSKAFFLSLVQLKAKYVVFFGGRESFWIIDFAMAAAAAYRKTQIWKWLQHTGPFSFPGVQGVKNIHMSCSRTLSVVLLSVLTGARHGALGANETGLRNEFCFMASVATSFWHLLWSWTFFFFFFQFCDTQPKHDCEFSLPPTFFFSSFFYV